MRSGTLGHVVAAAIAVVVAGCAETRAPGDVPIGEVPEAEVFQPVCGQCHGSFDSPSPPPDTKGGTDPKRRGVGAHGAHMAGGYLADPIPCQTCHIVPASLDAPGHADTALPAEVVFSGRATAAGSQPVEEAPAWQEGQETAQVTCRNVYCHGATLKGGALTSPKWNLPGQPATACDACHGDPPPAPHPQLARCGLCHSTATDDGGIADPSLHVNGTVDMSMPTTCNACHGSDQTGAPPPDLAGDTTTSSPGVGAHQAHLKAPDHLSNPVACSTCHDVPSAVGDPGHIDSDHATVKLTGLASAGASLPEYHSDTRACAGVYCHGASLTGGTLTSPVWTSADGSAIACGACHGFPPPSPHPQSSKCASCHAQTAGAGSASIAFPENHVNGKVEVSFAPGCAACHGSADNPAPPVGTGGETSTTSVAVGAHQSHLKGSGGIAEPVACGACHVVPSTAEDPGHIDEDPQVVFNGLAQVGDAVPVWSRGAAVCAGVYCHGATLAGGKATSPAWTKVDGSQETCDSCHGNPPPPPHPASAACSTCHGMTVGQDGKISGKSKHVNGVLDVSSQSCSSCHGSDDNAAPPKDVAGQSDTTLITVGAHQSHLKGAAGLAAPVACDECHVVPKDAGDAGHLDGQPDGDVEFGKLATTGGTSPAFDHDTARCSDAYCHGATLGGGTLKNPEWTQVDGTQAACGTCHGDPPPPPHPESSQCGTCHDQTATPDGQILDKTKHVDGKLQVKALACNTCHGSVANSAPPKDVGGGSDTTLITVGAHQSHLQGPAGLSAPVTCEDCHQVPADVAAPGHLDGTPDGDVKFGPLAAAQGADPAWEPASATCTGSYCHGATTTGGADTAPVWTKVDGTQVGCASCHGYPPPPPHAQSAQCGLCHTMTATADGKLKDKALHIDGKVEVIGQGCSSCHGNDLNAAPPTDTLGRSDPSFKTVGAHQAHLTQPDGLTQPVACSQCHVVPASIDAAGHLDGVDGAEVAFGALATAAGATPAWNTATATCSGAYCHGATLTGGTTTTPLWTNVDGTQVACGSCHGFPPPEPHVQSSKCGLCHVQTATVYGQLKDKSFHIDGQVQVAPMNCNSCHGSEANDAPPRDVDGNTATTVITVGAHQSHLLQPDGISTPVACDQCHVVPNGVAAAGHLDGAPGGDVAFGAIAKAGGATPQWTVATATCSGAYCHGATLQGGANKTPKWTQVDGTQVKCGTCHGNPPPPPHTTSTQCSACHTQTVNPDGTIKDPAVHLDGQIEVTQIGCSNCHGSADNAAPPKDVNGGTDPALPTVGAHQAHLKQPDGLSAPVACSQCHRVPTAVDAPGHLDGAAGGDVTFGAIATADGATPSWNVGTLKCTGAYCHGATLGGGTNKAPKWTTLDGSQVACGTCHGNPPPPPHPASSKCALCHTETMKADGTFKDRTLHVDGQVEVISMSCNSCHGSASNDAPPTDVNGGTDTILMTVGAHQSHVNPSDPSVAPIACDQCHGVPGKVDSPGHLDGAAGGDVKFGAMASAGGASPSWDPATGKCSGTYCHGATIDGGAHKTPVWNQVDGTQADCGSCHGNPPPSPHPASTQCSACHPGTVNPDGTIKDRDKHMDGQVEVTNQACNSCHGNDLNNAPPVDTLGRSDTSLPTVGAHQSHLVGPLGLAAAVACNECHVVPATVDAAGHLDGMPDGDVAFGTLAKTDAAKPAFDAGATTCSGTYCHGATLAGGTHTTPQWTALDGTQAACGSCHGFPPPAPHPDSTLCSFCHTQTVNPNGTIKDRTKHVDGTVQVTSQACNACHGSAKNAAPPVDTKGQSSTAVVTVGAHQTHLDGSDLAGPIACAECHVVPSTVDAEGHLDGTPGGGVTFGTMARNDGATPAWSATAAKCSGAYCHGATLAGGTNKTPQWTLVNGTQDACGTCHGNPPPAPHPQSTLCGFCHAQTAAIDGTIKDPSKHVDGTVEVVAQACNSCHGSAANAAPPVDTTGKSATTLVSVGAHQSHLAGAGGIASAVACGECHVVPATADAAGHLDLATGANVTFGTLAKTGGAAPSWDRATARCSGGYCHGATLAGGAAKSPLWTKVDQSQEKCGSCHGNPPPAPHVQNTHCGYCHSQTANIDGTLKDKTKHVDGVLEVSGQSCNSCHGNAAGNPAAAKDRAPPVDTSGQSSTSLVSVGAHQPHVVGPSGLSDAVACNECHVVPATVDAAAHLDGVANAEVAFGAMSKKDGAAPSWTRSNATCNGNYCHGATLAGGSNKTPVWTKVDGTQDACGTCHGNPPPSPHAQSPYCGFCHSQTANPDGTLKDKHIDGSVQVSGQSCNSCHGSAANNAPPLDTTGGSATTLLSVGAHQAHLLGSSSLSSPIACAECHVVPGTPADAGHLDLVPGATMTFGKLAKTGGASPAFNRVNAKCSGTWCHGSPSWGGANVTPVWTQVGTGQDACGTCHANPPPLPHPQSSPCSTCHPATVNADGTLKDKTRHVDGVIDVVSMACNACHGNATNAAPPVDVNGQSANTNMTVGAHQEHLQASSGLSAPVACGECHVVPATVTDAGHLEGAAGGDVAFGTIAKKGGSNPSWTAATGVCTNTYCHGSTMSGGTAKAPVWNKVDGTQDTCASCHGNPPPFPHPQQSPCSNCHGATMNADGSFKDRTLHVDGKVDVSAMACNSCHGGAANSAPPVDIYGLTATTNMTVGAHQAHLLGSSNMSAPVACAECHVVPTATTDPGHVDGVAGGDVAFGVLSKTGGLTPAWTAGTGVCASTYCHGATLDGGTNKLPVWNKVDGTQDACGTCHGNPPPFPHPHQTPCSKCHDATMNADGSFKDKTKHVNGALDLANLACNACHGNAAGSATLPANQAPPIDLYGQSATTNMTVGAHQAHLLASSGLSDPVACSECHVVPATTGAPGHVDGVAGGDVAFGAFTKTGGLSPAWNAATGACSNTYCHGASLAAGGTNQSPIWNKVDGTQDACGTCHGNPPPLPHAQNTHCGYCHTQTASIDGTIKDRTKHIDGAVETTGQSCNSCHGSAANNAPPVDTSGGSATTLVTVGAHQAHVTGPSGLASPYACSECHATPATVDAAGHLDGVANAEVPFGALAKTGGLSPAWDRVAAKCANTYCHGASLLAGGGNTTPQWTKVDGTQDACGTCHGNPPPAPHPQSAYCGFCHAQTANTSGAIKDKTKHVDGTVEVSGQACNSCHGSATDSAPPVDTTGGAATTLVGVGAHQAHLTATSSLSSPIACTECHVVPATVDATGHLDTTTGANVTFGNLAKTDGAAPAWDRTSAQCSGAYCHGATIAGGTDKVPQWTLVNGTQDACGTCHSTPPSAPHPVSTLCQACHKETMSAPTTFKDRTKHVDGTVQAASQTCNGGCHGSTSSAAPPVDVNGQSATTNMTVGAHQAHLLGSSNMSSPVACTECHTVPATVDATGHLDGAAGGDVVFGTLSKTGSLTPTWTVGTGVCASTYCHGASLGAGGTKTAPVWNIVDGTQDTCASCHGNPPPLPHAQQSQCSTCHGTTMNADGTFKDKTKHIDGILQITGGACNSCHGNVSGNAANPPDRAPPVDTTGGSATTLVSVGAHQPHLLGSSNMSSAIACNECHVVPAAVGDGGHMDTATPAELTFGTLSKTDGANPTWSHASATCSGNYCHGATLAGGTNKIPLWTKVDGTQDACGTCHGNPPPAPHSPKTQCGQCHDQTMNLDGTFKDRTKHIDGTVQVPSTCNGCHGNAAGSASNPPDQAPPVDLTDNTATSVRGVGAHQPHLLGSSNISSAVACNQCHLVPAGIEVTGHVDTTNPAEMTFGTLAKTGGLTPVWSTTAYTCTSTYCHGTSLLGGSLKVPAWTTVNNTQDACGTCHLNSLAANTARPHPVGVSGATCANCHGTVMSNSTTFLNKALHVNGTVNVAPPSGSFACNGVCHGTTGTDTDARRAPPSDTQGLTATTNKSVGDHQLHLAVGTISNAMPCNECHAVPTSVPATLPDTVTPTHLNKAVNVTFTIGTRAKKTTGAYNSSGPTCTTVYCHGGWTSSGGTTTSWSWTNTTAITTCTNACHGLPPSTGRHTNSNHVNRACGVCHDGVANTSTPNGITTAGKALHIDGAATVAFGGGASGTWNASTRTCSSLSCHSSKTWGTKVLP
jgi:predicted CxxxxCH...CXXCH cytochrome family protein